MTNCQGCGTDFLSTDRFCKNCGAPVAVSVEDLADTRPFDPSAPRVATAQTGSLDPQSYHYLPPSTFPMARSSAPLNPIKSLIKGLLERKAYWLLAAFLLFLFIGTGVTVGRDAVRARRAQRAEDARQVERARQARQAMQAAKAQRSFEDSIQNAMGFVPADVLNTEYPDTQGVFITSLTSDDSPAGVAKIQAGDVLIEVGDQPVRTSGELARVLNSIKPGSEVAAKIQRDEETVTTRIRIGSQTIAPFQPKIDPKEQGFFGVGDVARRCCVAGTKRWGVEVRRIIDNSPADLAGLQLGDLISEFDQKLIRTPNELARRIRAVKPRSKVKIKFFRGNTEQTVELIVGHGW